LLKQTGPLLLASNHPNSFLDGIILTTLFDKPLYSLTRGDVFKHKRIDQFLRRLQLLPIYRTKEGIKNLGHNYTTFDACQKTFEKNGMVLIFSEGLCENEWHLRTLKKGTARLALTAWSNNLPLKVIPVGINYSSFKKFGKEVHINFGEPVLPDIPEEEEVNGKNLNTFNLKLNDQLQKLVYEINPSDKARVRSFFHPPPITTYILLFIPSIAGWILHAPLFYCCKWFTDAKFKNSGHYDSVLHSLLILLYPFYLLAFFIIFSSIHTWLGISFLVLLPFTAWSWVKIHL
jgi:1-acyl-sn-glycerol-3-phosphate acyltransferase